MKKILIPIMITLLLSCDQVQNKSSKQTSSDSNANQQLIQVAERIKMKELQRALLELQSGKTEFQFIGITSNGIDCIYFVFENERFNIEFEAMESDQLPY